MTQGQLFEPRPHGGELPLPYQRMSETSRAAACMAEASAESARRRVGLYVAGQGEQGATRDEISRGLGIPIQTVCARVDDLLKSSVLFRTSRTRATAMGRAAEVLVSM